MHEHFQTNVGTCFTNFFDFYNVLFLLCFLLTLHLFILELTVINDSTNRWLSCRRNLNKVKKLGFREVKIVAYIDGEPVNVDKAREWIAAGE